MTVGFLESKNLCLPKQYQTSRMDAHFKCLRDVLAESDDLDIPDYIRAEFIKTIKCFIAVHEDENTTKRKDVSGFITAVKAIFDISTFAFSLLSNLLPFPINIAVKVVIAVSNIVYGVQKMSKLLDGLADILNYQLLSLCKKAVLKLQTSISFLAGVLKDLSSSSNPLHTSTILSSISGDASIQIGLDEIGLLATQMDAFIQKGDSSSFPEFMEKTQLYCLLSSLRELLLMFRLAVFSKNGIPVSSILNVLVLQRDSDKKLLSFLFRPKQTTLDLYLNYFSVRSDWPIVESFLANRNLRVDDLPSLDLFKYQISSFAYPELQLSLVSYLFSKGICGIRNSRGQDSEFTFQGGYDNVFLIRPVSYPQQYVMDCKMDSRREPPVDGFWKVVKIADESSEDTLYVVFVKAATKDKCLYVSQNGKTYMKSFGNQNTGCVWKLHRLEERDCIMKNTSFGNRELSILQM